MGTIFEKPFHQFRKPTGALGRVIVKSMNETHYHLTTWGLSKVDFKQQDTILDIGCGGGRTVSRLLKKADKGMVYGIDYSEDCVKWSKKRNQQAITEGRAAILQASVEAIPFSDEMFDKITAVETIYFWPNLAENFKEVCRVLKTGGLFLIINEAYQSEAFRERNDQLVKVGHMRILSPEEAKEMLLDAGFSSVTTETCEEKNWLCCMAVK